MRQPKTFFRQQTKSWYVRLDGTQYSLGRDESAAWTKYHALLAKRPNPADTPAETTAVGLLLSFLQWCHDEDD